MCFFSLLSPHPQQTVKSNYFSSVPWLIKEIFPFSTNKIKQPMLRRRDVANNFLDPNKQTIFHTPLCPICCRGHQHKVEQLQLNWEVFCQIAVLCKYNTCISVPEICCSITLMFKRRMLNLYSTDVLRWVLHCSVRLLWNSQSCCRRPSCLFWVLLNIKIIPRLHNTERAICLLKEKGCSIGWWKKKITYI